jgi:hypothetical protein
MPAAASSPSSPSLREGPRPLFTAPTLAPAIEKNDEVRTGLVCVSIYKYILTLSFDIIYSLLYYLHMFWGRGCADGEMWGVVWALVDWNCS